MYNPKMYTVESVTSGHPDKVCDQISDAIVDACLKEDPMSRVAVEAFGCHGKVFVGGEVTTTARPDYEAITRAVYEAIGYTEPIEVLLRVVEQSPDISQGVDTGGAGDQGIMYGYAEEGNDAFLPDGVVFVHAMASKLEALRKQGVLPWLMPDGKTQVTISDGEILSALISTQHAADVSQEEIRRALIEHVFAPVLKDTRDIEMLVNPTGQFIQGGFDADTGLTGRKIMVDTYGGLAPHGGGAFSGKDPTKVDRSAAYMARFAAKNIVANGFAKKCLVSVAYAIGRAEPLMVEALDENGKSVASLTQEKFDFRPKAIIERLDLRRPIYQGTAAYGHFGKEGLPWEKIVSL